MQLNENGFKKLKSKWIVETWPHVQPFHGEGVVSAILVDKEKEKENLRLLISFGFVVFGYQWQKKKGNPKETRRINVERKHKRLEKENWKTQKKHGKDKFCAFHFYFIFWTWCVLGLHF